MGYKGSLKEKQRMRDRRNNLFAAGLCVNCGANRREMPWQYCASCKIRRGIAAKQRLTNIRQKVLEIYGDRCACCGEKEYWFLTIDHINNDGWKERKVGGKNTTSSEMICRRLVFGPKRDDIQILCYNCNCAKQRIGFCPHNPHSMSGGKRRVRGARIRNQ